jgi:type I restriction enzyme S subunit
MVIAGYIIRVRLKKEVEPIYLSMYLNLPSSKKMLSEMAKGSVNQTNINAKEFQSISVPVPPVELQREFVAIANAAEASKAELKKSITSIDAVMKGLING